MLRVGKDDTPDDDPTLCGEHKLFVGDGVDTLVVALEPIFNVVNSGCGA